MILFIQMTSVCYITLHVASRNPVQPKNAEFSSNQVLSESSVNGNVSLIFQIYISDIFATQSWQRSSCCFLLFFSQMIQRPHSNSGPTCLEDLVAKEENAINIANPIQDQFINDIISSTPELRQFHGYVDAR